MKRKLKWTAVVLAVLLLGFGAAIFLWPRDRITAESWEKIRIGMTSEEVEKILGGPGIKAPFTSQRMKAGPQVPPTIHFWLGRNGFIEIEFDNDGRVMDKYFHEIHDSESNIVDRLREWLGW
jgi:hypothetical protein